MQDRAARLFLYCGEMEAEWAAYGQDAQMVCTAFVNGINAAVDQVVAGTLGMPPEFVDWAPTPQSGNLKM